MTLLTLKSKLEAPLEAAAIVPDHFPGKTAADISGLEVTYGNQTARIGDFFLVDGNGTSEIILKGDLTRVKNIAAGMTEGKVTVHGDVGMHLGSAMQGGEIDVHGTADD